MAAPENASVKSAANAAESRKRCTVQLLISASTHVFVLQHCNGTMAETRAGHRPPLMGFILRLAGNRAWDIVLNTAVSIPLLRDVHATRARFASSLDGTAPHQDCISRQAVEGSLSIRTIAIMGKVRQWKIYRPEDRAFSP
jgi:hypothetical protein